LTLISVTFRTLDTGAWAGNPPVMLRACHPELLDSLPPDHPDAIHNRRDLRIINRIMGNRGWFERTLPRLLLPGDRVLELGAGTGEMGLALIRRGIPVDGLDLWPRPGNWPAEREWHTANLNTFSGYGAYAVVIANLILHQFTAMELSSLGGKLQLSARVILACEPERRRASQVLMGAIGPLLGANHVTLHDARVSIEAGFKGEELPDFLGLDAEDWLFSCRTTAGGALRMVAVRKP
jgi:hypothetical protein